MYLPLFHALLRVGARRFPDRRSCRGLQGHDEIVWAVEVAGQRLFSASADKTIRVWDIESRRCEQVRTAAPLATKCRAAHVAASVRLQGF